MKFCFWMDPYQSLNLETETSLLMINSLLSRGHQVDWVQIEGLALHQDRLMGEVRQVNSTAPFELEEPQWAPLSQYDCLVIRKDPPFDLNYFHATLLLQHLPESVVQVNPASILAEYNEKLVALNWPEYTPETWTGMSPEGLWEFIQLHQQVVVKPLGECSGRGIELLNYDTPQLYESLPELFLGDQGEPRFLTAQRFLPEVATGDKRIFLVAGEPVGMVNRVPAKGSFLGNIHQGAICQATELTEQESKIVADLGPKLMAKGLFLVGLDMIGGMVTEINLTSPSAVRQINEVLGRNIMEEIVPRMIQYLEQQKRP